ncbi:PTS sugar transporter subunit IIA [Mycetocola reblochoni]|uniref:Ascorbate-specific PTS system EIIA component n=2 Tax=Mycetocola reblochoni TaxID=331618 RepID=A0A1R4K086_9MICO|nr:PTS sugar transporter subunit IIA [Mycetocola reblochoni]RLP70502.1 PTS sugar transporter subunit IIA [Mycetocola reblochoni]SJN37574.1 phosphotransferase system protein, mannitol/fructose-specific IIA subunit [Mycetocola reblochoni REB411]
MPLPPLPASAISLRAEAADWRQAVARAGEALERSGATLAGYADRMVEVITAYGAYVVVAPGLALVHARPGDDVLSEGIAVVTLAEPVSFGHPYNDPVSVVVAVASVSNDEHVTSVAELANVFNDPQAVPRLAAATSVDEVSRLFAEGEAG